MRSKLASAGLVGVLGFLLVTNPVVVDAAGQITGAQIKNESITSKDIKNNQVKGRDVKNGGLTAADLAPGTIPPATTQVRRFFSTSSGTEFLTATLAFTGSTTVTLDGNDVVISTGTVNLNGAAGDDVNVGMCSRPAGSSAVPTPLGGASAASTDVDLAGGDTVVSASGAFLPGAGSYEIGVCANTNAVNVGLYETIGWVAVLDSATADIGPAAPRSVRGDARRQPPSGLTRR